MWNKVLNNFRMRLRLAKQQKIAAWSFFHPVTILSLYVKRISEIDKLKAIRKVFRRRRRIKEPIWKTVYVHRKNLYEKERSKKEIQHTIFSCYRFTWLVGYICVFCIFSQFHSRFFIYLNFIFVFICSFVLCTVFYGRSIHWQFSLSLSL